MQENSRAEQVSTFMLDTFSAADPWTYSLRDGAHPETAEELLARAGRRVREDLSGHPLVRAKLMEAIGRAYRRRGDDKSAVSFLQEAVQLRKSLSAGQDDMPTAEALLNLAMTMLEGGDVVAADGVLVEAKDILQRLNEQHSAIYARMIANRGRAQMKLGKPDAAQAFLRRGARTAPGPQTRARSRGGSAAGRQVDCLRLEGRFRRCRAQRPCCRRNLRHDPPPVASDRTSAQSQLGETLRVWVVWTKLPSC
jgi:tetratricopeptide (TPR) repeat protein